MGSSSKENGIDIEMSQIQYIYDQAYNDNEKYVYEGIRLCPENYFFWNKLKHLLESSNSEEKNSEIYKQFIFNTEILYSHTKAYQPWYHRRFMLEKYVQNNTELRKPIFEKDYNFLNDMLKKDERNLFAWNYILSVYQPNIQKDGTDEYNTDRENKDPTYIPENNEEIKKIQELFLIYFKQNINNYSALSSTTLSILPFLAMDMDLESGWLYSRLKKEKIKFQCFCGQEEKMVKFREVKNIKEIYNALELIPTHKTLENSSNSIEPIENNTTDKTLENSSNSIEPIENSSNSIESIENIFSKTSIKIGGILEQSPKEHLIDTITFYSDKLEITTKISFSGMLLMKEEYFKGILSSEIKCKSIEYKGNKYFILDERSCSRRFTMDFITEWEEHEKKVCVENIFLLMEHMRCGADCKEYLILKDKNRRRYYESIETHREYYMDEIISHGE